MKKWVSKSFKSITIVSFLLLLLSSADVFAITNYTIIDIDTLGGNRSDAYGINNLGQVVGSAKDENGKTQPFLYDNGDMINLSAIGAFTSGNATGINDLTQIVGYASSEVVLFGFPPSDKHAFIYSNGSMIYPGVLRGENGIPSAINNFGLITGEYYFGGTTRSFIYPLETNDMHGLGTFGGTHSYGYGINDVGQAVGSATTLSGDLHAFLYDNETMIDLGTAEGNLSQAYDINNFGHIVGYFSPVPSTGDSRHPFLYDGNEMIDIGTLGGNSARATALNDIGQVVGWSITESSNTHAFIYENGIIHDLNDLIPQDSNWDFLIEAFDINNKGQIVGNGRVDLDDDGIFDEIHAFLLTPISKPTIDTILDFFDESVEAETIVGDGRGNSANGRLNALRNMLEMAGNLIDIDNIEGACRQLNAASRKCDGETRPPDFVTGEVVTDLYDMILDLMEELGCE